MSSSISPSRKFNHQYPRTQQSNAYSNATKQSNATKEAITRDSIETLNSNQNKFRNLELEARTAEITAEFNRILKDKSGY